LDLPICSTVRYVAPVPRSNKDDPTSPPCVTRIEKNSFKKSRGSFGRITVMQSDAATPPLSASTPNVDAHRLPTRFTKISVTLIVLSVGRLSEGNVGIPEYQNPSR
jgi:hypothetical protein